MYSGHAITKGMYPLSFCFEHKYVRFYTGLQVISRTAFSNNFDQRIRFLILAFCRNHNWKK